MLHLTNGDSTAHTLRATGITEEALPWRDVLRSGPVPAVPAAQLRQVRARHLASTGHVGEPEVDEPEVLAFLTERDRTREIRPFLGATSCFHLLAELATGEHPLVGLDRGPDPAQARTWRVSLTDHGWRCSAVAPTGSP